MKQEIGTEILEAWEEFNYDFKNLAEEIVELRRQIQTLLDD